MGDDASDLHQASVVLDALRAEGFTIALDNFGCCYSSIRHISGMPLDLIKFDMSLIRELSGDGRQSRLIAGLARLIIDAGYQVVAEGVDSPQVLARIMDTSFSHAQGYYLGSPKPPPGT